ncbi:hypothetical protein AXG93_4905s1320 [Marchantia polymorpha subsp. ruderalis]|uniref:Uncharacterized protein n=1 Tax=Marchantia polymorpha subsp. ruderalis TaxID=1480154 RepID=A0A176VJ94_MARPO|nr:hypothetical protein AXG93_4905s1320 [Marchantia polymorpha subsp. ruderalis]
MGEIPRMGNAKLRDGPSGASSRLIKQLEWLLGSDATLESRVHGAGEEKRLEHRARLWRVPSRPVPSLWQPFVDTPVLTPVSMVAQRSSVSAAWARARTFSPVRWILRLLNGISRNVDDEHL